MLEVFGELEAFNRIMGIDHATVEIMDPTEGGKVVKRLKKEPPDNILLQGSFQSDTFLSYQMRAGKVFPGEPGCRRLINGDKGDIQLTSPRACFAIEHIGVEIKYRKDGEEVAEVISLPPLPPDELSEVEQPAQNIGLLCDAFAKGEPDLYADWN